MIAFKSPFENVAVALFVSVLSLSAQQPLYSSHIKAQNQLLLTYADFIKQKSAKTLISDHYIALATPLVHLRTVLAALNVMRAREVFRCEGRAKFVGNDSFLARA